MDGNPLGKSRGWAFGSPLVECSALAVTEADAADSFAFGAVGSGVCFLVFRMVR